MIWITMAFAGGAAAREVVETPALPTPSEDYPARLAEVEKQVEELKARTQGHPKPRIRLLEVILLPEPSEPDPKGKVPTPTKTDHGPVRE